jgi:prepilin-type N-terminal cleavage/methylation domain-containing protein
MRRPRRQGFTLVEVMVSIGIMTIGGMAVLAMQQQLIRANMHARELTTATQIAQNWIERLKLDALAWNAIGDLSQTRYLNLVPAPGTIGTFGRIVPWTATRAGVSELQSGAYDYYGDALDTTGGSPAGLHFCASMRLSWIYDNRRAMRADVRVFWPRAGEAALAADYPRCNDDDAALNPAGTRIDNYHIVYLSTVLKANYP